MLDLNMPKLNGIEASKQIREIEKQQKLDQTPLYIVTGNCSSETIELCIDQNGPVRASKVVIKPLTQGELHQISQNIMMGNNK